MYNPARDDKFDSVLAYIKQAMSFSAETIIKKKGAPFLLSPSYTTPVESCIQ